MVRVVQEVEKTGTKVIDRETIVEREWKVRRHGRLQALHQANGRIVYQVKVWDHGRDAFITVPFNDEVPATEFLDRVERENEEAFNEPSDHSTT